MVIQFCRSIKIKEVKADILCVYMFNNFNIMKYICEGGLYIMKVDASFTLKDIIPYYGMPVEIQTDRGI